MGAQAVQVSDADTSDARRLQTRATFDLVLALLHRLPDGYLEVSADHEHDETSMTELADKVYATTDGKAASAFADALRTLALSNALAHLLSLPPHTGALRLVPILATHVTSPMRLDWRAAPWLDAELSAAKDAPFDFVSALVPALLALRTSKIEPAMVLDRRATIEALIDRVRVLYAGA
jgi:hypothetical protein